MLYLQTSDDIHHVLVHPLEEELLKPLLEGWMKSNSEDPRPYRWYGVFLNTEKRVDYLHNALRLGGSNEQLSLLILINFNLVALWYSFHHISEDLYLGDIKENTALITKSLHLNNKVECQQTRNNNNEALNYYQDLLNDWVLFTKNNLLNGVKIRAEIIIGSNPIITKNNNRMQFLFVYCMLVLNLHKNNLI
ncbi:hypothetical protein M1D95_10580 [Bacillus sp. PK3-130]